MTADEMFQNLGYRKVKNDPDQVRYRHKEDFSYVDFYPEDRSVFIMDDGDCLTSTKMIRAINKFLDEMEKDNWMPFTGGESDGKR